MKSLRNQMQVLEYAALISVAIAFMLFCGLMTRGVSIGHAVVVTVVGLIGAFVFLIAAVLSGRWRHGDLEVSPWFAWFVAGSAGLFWVGAVIAGRVRGGVLTVLVYGSVLLTLWLIFRMKRSQPVDPPNPRIRSGR